MQLRVRNELRTAHVSLVCKQMGSPSPSGKHKKAARTIKNIGLETKLREFSCVNF